MKPVSTESPLLQEALIGTHTHPGQTLVNPQQCQRPFVLLWGYSHLSNIPPTPRLQLQRDHALCYSSAWEKASVQ